MMLDGIDGLYGYRGDLVAIQNGVIPRAIVRLRLNREGTRVVEREVIERGHPQWGEPTTGFVNVADRARIYVADAPWERFGEGGEVRGDDPLRATQIRITPIESDLTPPPSGSRRDAAVGCTPGGTKDDFRPLFPLPKALP